MTSKRQLTGAGDRVVAFTGEDGEAFAADADFDAVVILGAVVAARIVAQGVLVAGLFGDAGVEIFERIAFGGVEDVAAGIVGVGLETGEFALIETTADSEAVDGDAIAEEFFDRV